MMENSRLIAYSAYRALLDELSELQRNWVLRNLIQQQFGSDAVILSPFMRRITINFDVLSNSRKNITEENESDARRIGELTACLRDFEAVMSKAKAEDDKQSAEALADFIRQRWAGKK